MQTTIRKLAFLLLATATLLAACGNDDNGITPTPGSIDTSQIDNLLAATATPVPLLTAPRSPGTLFIWHAYGTGSAEEAALIAVIKNAQETLPDLTIDVLQLPQETIYDQWEAGVAAISGPDILIAPNDRLPGLARDGLVLDLTDPLAGQLDGFSDTALTGMSVDGRLFGVPQSLAGTVLYYDKTRIASPPQTTEALLTAQQSSQTVGNIVSAYYLYSFIPAFGGVIIDDSGTTACPQQDGIVAAFQYLVNLKNFGGFFDVEIGRVDELFLDGTLAMIGNGSWELSHYEAALGDDLGVAPLPSGTAPARPLINGDGLYINPKSRNVETALELVLKMTDMESAEIWANTASHIPARNNIVLADPNLQMLAQALNTGQSVPDSPSFEFYWDIFDDAFSQVLKGTSDPVDVVAAACTALQEAIDSQ